MPRPYFILAERDAVTGRWSPEFGDFDRKCVLQERTDRRECYPFPLACNLRVVRCDDARQITINAAVAAII